MPAPTIVDQKLGGSPADSPHDGDGRLHLVILGRDGAVPRALPVRGQILIGRDDEADLRLADPRASRHHARITIGETIEIEDLASANGTRVRDQPISPRTKVRLERGDAIAIGGTLMILQSGAPEVSARRVWSHGYLETRLIEECGRAQNDHSSLALARVHLTAPASAILVEEIITNLLRGGELLAAYAPGEYEILMLGTNPIAARVLLDGVVAALRGRQIDSTTALAIYPADGTSPQALIGRAAERVSAGTVAASAGTAAGQPGVIVESKAMRNLHALAHRAAAGNSHVLIVGETGAGKEVLAETVHRASPRAAKPFLALNCAALTESLVESELFGYERGAFTGANQAKVGLLEAAAGGTVFLDEIGEMPLPTQAKLLRVLETRQVLRVGATQTRAIDVRFLAATNRDLEEEVAEKRFREDLYFRLNVITLEIPPLRERPEEIEPLARMFLGRLAEAVGRSAPVLSAESLALLRGCAWPGNIRELRNVIERAFVLCAGAEITADHLPVEKMRRRPVEAPPAAGAPHAKTPPTGEEGSAEPRGLKEIERQAIVDALERCHFNQTRAAELLGMPRRTFCKRLREYAIPRPRA